ncbi:hypothetical protein UFOVP376_24 [uncultured Caudovirales phage]|uniref:Uncharacterized protein n=1 Tax=uncultured Caudovirales phage TaxID=2100421 RepID=A0A6J7X0Y7_9CAUD|nr:hypothetical protein UFOVP376_24 [uncultured Caudovirales phage]
MNIIELAKQAGFVEYELDDGTTEAFDKRYAKFADLVAAAARADEREACAKVCDDNYFAFVAADEIRARGTT